MTGIGAQPVLKCMFIIYVIFSSSVRGRVDVWENCKMLSKVGVIEA
jgi:hypothetical protein